MESNTTDIKQQHIQNKAQFPTLTKPLDWVKVLKEQQFSHIDDMILFFVANLDLKSELESVLPPSTNHSSPSFESFKIIRPPGLLIDEYDHGGGFPLHNTFTTKDMETHIRTICQKEKIGKVLQERWKDEHDACELNREHTNLLSFVDWLSPDNLSSYVRDKGYAITVAADQLGKFEFCSYSKEVCLE